ncbi:hypothetical protein GQ600_6523 [Phytophthora cactorum]|nr:hypothetical protein GQ600_6523 [Phytophthora cactorum]
MGIFGWFFECWNSWEFLHEQFDIFAAHSYQRIPVWSAISVEKRNKHISYLRKRTEKWTCLQDVHNMLQVIRSDKGGDTSDATRAEYVLREYVFQEQGIPAYVDQTIQKVHAVVLQSARMKSISGSELQPIVKQDQGIRYGSGHSRKRYYFKEVPKVEAIAMYFSCGNMDEGPSGAIVARYPMHKGQIEGNVVCLFNYRHLCIQLSKRSVNMAEKHDQYQVRLILHLTSLFTSCALAVIDVHTALGFREGFDKALHDGKLAGYAALR